MENLLQAQGINTLEVFVITIGIICAISIVVLSVLVIHHLATQNKRIRQRLAELAEEDSPMGGDKG